jgi:YD repeat-containing protein
VIHFKSTSWSSLVACRRGLSASTLLLCCLSSWLVAQQTSRYVYDDDGRLRAVIAPTGAAAVYEYDAAGNFTAIRRLTTDDLEVLAFSPRSGVVGTRVVFYGVGFGPGVSSVTFAGGAAGTLVGFTSNTITAIVPAGAVTGPVTIATARGPLTTTPFLVQGIALDPSNAQILEGENLQFNATVIVPGDDSAISWSVNGTKGGTAVLGTITQTGLYTAPLDPPANLSVAVEATSLPFPEISGAASLRVRNLSDFAFALSPGVAVGKGSQYAFGVFSPSVVIGKGSDFSLALFDRVAVARGNDFQAAFGPGVSLTKGPVITGISPGSVSQQSNTNVTISGTNFGGANSVTFLNVDGSSGFGMSVSNLNVSGNGQSMTFSLSVAGATVGRKIVIVRTPMAHSPIADLSVNVIQVTP